VLSDRSIKKDDGKGKRGKRNTIKRRRSKEVWIPMYPLSPPLFPNSTDVGSYLDGCPPAYLLV